MPEIDYASLNVESLEEELDKIDEQLIGVKAQLTRAGAEFTELGITSDSDWLTRATTAKRILSKKRQKLQSVLGKVRRAQKEIKHQEHEQTEFQIFKQVVKRRISEELFKEIIDEVIFLREGK